MPQVTLTGEEFDALRNARRVAEERAAQLERELVEARKQDPNGRIEHLTKLARDMLTIVRFGIANMPPETVRGWPIDALVAVAAGLEHLPDYTADDRELALFMQHFAAEAHEIEAYRKTPEYLEERRRLEELRKLEALDPAE